MEKIKDKISAQELRKQGHSLSEIVSKIKISKSTASVWCRDISMSAVAQKKLKSRTTEKSLAGLAEYSKRIKNNKILQIKIDAKIGSNKLGEISNRDIYCIGLGLYWGEGYKSGSQEFGFTNSDPEMILFYIKWLETIFLVKKNDLILRVSINELHKKREIQINQFWSNLTAVPLLQFTKMSFIKSVSKKSYPNSNNYMGTLRIKVRKGTRMRREVIGAIKYIKV